MRILGEMASIAWTPTAVMMTRFLEYYEVRNRLHAALKAKPMLHPQTGRLMPAQADAIDRSLPQGYRVDRDHDVVTHGTIRVLAGGYAIEAS